MKKIMVPLSLCAVAVPLTTVISCSSSSNSSAAIDDKYKELESFSNITMSGVVGSDLLFVSKNIKDNNIEATKNNVKKYVSNLDAKISSFIDNNFKIIENITISPNMTNTTRQQDGKLSIFLTGKNAVSFSVTGLFAADQALTPIVITPKATIAESNKFESISDIDLSKIVISNYFDFSATPVLISEDFILNRYGNKIIFQLSEKGLNKGYILNDANNAAIISVESNDVIKKTE